MKFNGPAILLSILYSCCIVSTLEVIDETEEQAPAQAEE